MIGNVLLQLKQHNNSGTKRKRQRMHNLFIIYRQMILNRMRELIAENISISFSISHIIQCNMHLKVLYKMRYLLTSSFLLSI